MNSQFINLDRKERGADKKPNSHTEHLFKTFKVLEMGTIDF